VDADLSILRKGCVYWDLFIITDKEGEEAKYPAALGRKMRKKIKSLFWQCELGDYIAFPHTSLTNTLAFTHREKTPYDTRATRAKEISAYVFYRLFGMKYRKQKI
ncbi:MAG: hypothetical protein IKI38_05470, partial [Mogibacterium sp.]|nr:hypothetical protein [Mogibacterium sp.]